MPDHSHDATAYLVRKIQAGNLVRKVEVACEYYGSGGQRPHLLWYYDELMSRLNVTDLGDHHLAAIIAALQDAHTGKLSPSDCPQPPGGVFVPVVGSTIPKRRLEAV